MLNNFWEELKMTDPVIQFHEEELSKWGIPKWMNIKCPFCDTQLPLRSIRSITVKLNTRNMGDLALEICCDKCLKMDTIYFRQEVSKMSDVIPFLSGEKEPKSQPVIEEKMYKMMYNNAVEKMVGLQGGKNVNS